MFWVTREGPAHFVDIEVNYRCGEQRQHLADGQAADDGDAQGLAQFGAVPVPSASGKPPKSAASVVIMMGRKRRIQAS